MKGLYLALILFLSSFGAFAQENFRSITDGAWDSPTTWERDSDGDFIYEESPASITPDVNSGTIIIQSGTTVTVSADVTVDQTTVQAGGILIINSGVNLFLSDDFSSAPILDVAGSLTNNGNLDLSGLIFSPCQISGQFTNSGDVSYPDPLNPDPSLVQFADNSFYYHNFGTGGSIPRATWASTSTCEIQSLTSASPISPSNFDQSFGNLTWNTPGMGATSTFALSGVPTAITGNLTFITSNGKSVRFKNAGTGYDLTINGNFNNQGVPLLLAQALTTATTVTVMGSYSQTATGGTPSLTFGQSNSATVNFEVRGNFTKSAGTFNRGTFTSSAALSNLLFGGNTTYLFSGTVSTAINYTVKSGSTLDLGVSALTGSGTFNLNSNATLKVGALDAGGAIQTGTLAGNIRVSGTRTFANPSTIIYNGGSLQYLGNGHPSTDGINTTIQNAGDVALATDATIGGLLYLDIGNLIVGGFTLTMNDEFLADSPSSLNVSTTSNITIGVGDAGPFGTLVMSGSTTINNLTFDRSGQTLYIGTNLTINGTLTHNANINFSGFIFDIKGPYTTTGGSLIGNASSSLIISGSGTLTGDISLSGTLGTLTINRPVGVTNTTSVTIANELNILSGTYQGTGLVILSPGATLTRAEGTITKSLSVTTYNLVYTNGGALITGSELITSPSTALTNLTIAGGNSVTVGPSVTDLTVNGTLSLLGGEFISDGKGIILEGDFVSSGTGTFTNSLVTFSGNTTLSGGVNIELDDVRIEGGATLDLGSDVNLFVSGDFTPQSGSIMLPGVGMTTFFNGTTTLLLPDVNTVPRFNHLAVTGGSTLTISCTDCGTENDRPYIEVNGNWRSFTTGAVFNPAPGDARTGVRLTGDAQTIQMLPAYPFWDLWIAGTETATLETALAVSNDLELEGSKTLSTSTSNFDITIGGDFLFDGGTFAPNQGTVTFNGTSTQTIDGPSGAGAATFFNITVNKAGGSFSNLTNTELQNVFTLSTNTAVDFDGAGSDTFTLLSTASRTASIGAILSPAAPSNISGSVIAQRFMHAEGEIFRYISSPVVASAAELQDDFPITGQFTGTSTCPTFQPGAASMFINLESVPGTLEAGYQGFPLSSNTESFAAGRGYAAMMCDGASQITFDITGAINKGNVALPVSYTSTGSSADGYNLVGNPYPSAIDWSDADWTKTNMAPTIFIRDNGLVGTPGQSAGGGTYATYNSSTGIGTNGGSKNIAVGQAFWVLATGASPVLTATEGVKLHSQPIFFREITPRNLVRITLSKGIYRDEAVIHFRPDATSNFDTEFDAPKFPNDIFSFSTFNADSMLLAVNTVEGVNCSREFGVSLEKAAPGDYLIEFTEFETFEEAVEIRLLDLFTNQIIEVGETSLYAFSVTDNPLSAGKNRFRILMGSGFEINTQLPANPVSSCLEGSKIQIEGSQAGVNYYATLNGVKVSDEVTGTGTQAAIIIDQAKLSDGENHLLIFARMGDCAALPLANAATVIKDRIYEIVSGVQGVACNEGAVTLEVKGASTGGSYNWYESGSDTQPIVNETEGKFETPLLTKTKTYFASVVNALGCEGPRFEVKAEVVHFEDAKISAFDNVLTSNHTIGNQWYFNGSPLSGEVGQQLTVTMSGEYTVEVGLAGGCKTTDTFNYLVTGLEMLSDKFVSIFPNPADDKVNITVRSTKAIYGEILSASGAALRTLNFVMENDSQSATVNMLDLQAGFYIVKVKEGNNIVYRKLIKN